MFATGIYRKLSEAIDAIGTATSEKDVWVRVKSFAAEFDCYHCLALDQSRLSAGFTKALMYSDAPMDVCHAIDREGLYVQHPFETVARETCLPFLVSEVRRDDRFQGKRWSEVMSDTLLQGDAVVAPVIAKDGLSGAAIFGGRGIKDSPIARSSLMVIAHVAFERIAALHRGIEAPSQTLLSSREIDCLQMLARGLTDDEIGRALGISRRTVRYHVDHAKQKLGVTSRVHAVAAAVNRGMITL